MESENISTAIPCQQTGLPGSRGPMSREASCRLRQDSPTGRLLYGGSFSLAAGPKGGGNFSRTLPYISLYFPACMNLDGNFRINIKAELAEVGTEHGHRFATNENANTTVRRFALQVTSVLRNRTSSTFWIHSSGKKNTQRYRPSGKKLELAQRSVA